MRYAGLRENDVFDGEGICTSFWVQGCPIHCKGCHNPQTWDFNGGLELPENYLDKLDEAIRANGVHRNFSLLGGEPFCEQNKELTCSIIQHVRNEFPDILIFAWTGYYYKDLVQDKDFNEILPKINYLIEGPFVEELRDITLPLRGSTNQNIIKLK